MLTQQIVDELLARINGPWDTANWLGGYGVWRKLGHT